MPTTTPNPASKLGTVIRVTSGNFLEMFDFFLFGFYASNIAAAFPAKNEFASLRLTFGTFGRLPSSSRRPSAMPSTS